jgi:hypothetical protein
MAEEDEGSRRAMGLLWDRAGQGMKVSDMGIRTHLEPDVVNVIK